MSGLSPKRWLKAVVFAIGCAAVSPLIFLAWIEARVTRGEAVFIAFAQLLAMVPGRVGTILRGAYYYGTLKRSSWETHIGFGSLFTHRGAVLASNVSMGTYCVIGHANIGSKVMMGSRVSIPSGKRQHFGESREIVAEVRYDTVDIGGGSWIGEGAIVLASVGQGCIVSAGAVVTKAMPDSCIVCGNPAQVISKLG